jgi:hypothetical protein
VNFLWFGSGKRWAHRHLCAGDTSQQLG